MKKTWITAKEINQFCYCPEQWRLTKLHQQGLVEADEQKLRIKKRLFQNGVKYHRKKAMVVWMRTKGLSWGLLAVAFILMLIMIWLVINQ